MSYTNQVFLGFDPGGNGGFGAAMLVGRKVTTTTVNTVADAVRWAVGQCGSRIPVAAGVGSLLHWSDGPSGWRPADEKLKAAHPPTERSVVAPNGLRGAMAVGGMALALRLRQRWSAIILTGDPRPKLLVLALGGDRYANAAPDAALA